MQYLRERYEFGRQLGCGAYGVVYSATRKEDGLPVAIKFLCQNKERPPSEILYTQMCAGVKGVIKLYEWHRGPFKIGRRVAHHAMVLERFGTKDLFDHITAKRVLDLKEAFTIFVQLVRVWKDLYGIGVCHNDLKDENVLISEDTGEVRLIDFSCASMIGGTEYFQGTRVYRPPEFVSRQEFDVESADSWAFGILLFNMLHGDVPFETDQEIVEGKFECTRGSPESTELITKCLDPVARNRPSIEDLLKESESILAKL